VQRLCGECEEWVTFLYEKMNVMIGVAMLVIMNGYNRTGGSNAFLMMFSCAGNGCGDDAWRRGRGWGYGLR
jgi:hypothetical protein